MEIGDGHLEGEEHFAGMGRPNLVASQPCNNHGQRVLNGLGVAQRVEDVSAESGAGADGCAGAAPLVEVAEGTGTDRRRLAQEAVGFGVAAERIF